MRVEILGKAILSIHERPSAGAMTSVAINPKSSTSILFATGDLYGKKTNVLGTEDNVARTAAIRNPIDCDADGLLIAAARRGALRNGRSGRSQS